MAGSDDTEPGGDEQGEHAEIGKDQMQARHAGKAHVE